MDAYGGPAPNWLIAAALPALRRRTASAARLPRSGKSAITRRYVKAA
jgi:hypothetical protein